MPFLLAFCLLFSFLASPAHALDALSDAEAFRTRYNAAAREAQAPLMPPEAAESVSVPDDRALSGARSTVRIYYLNEYVSLLLNGPVSSANRPEDGPISGAAVMARLGDDVSLSAVPAVQAAMRALVMTMTPDLADSKRQKILVALGIEGGESGDFTDGVVRSLTSGSFFFYTAATERHGMELVIKPVSPGKR